MARTHTVDELLDWLYRASGEPERWTTAIARIAAHVGATGGYLLRQGSGRFVVTTSGVAAGAFDHAYDHPGFRDDPRLAQLLKHDGARFLSEGDAGVGATSASAAYYREIRRPLGLSPSAEALLPTPGADIVVFGVVGFADEQACQAAIAELDRLHPHIARAAGLATQAAHLETVAVLGGLDTLGAPAAVLDRRAEVVAANEAFLASSRRWLDAKQRLRLGDGVSEQALHSAIAVVGLLGGPKQTFPVPGDAKHAPALLHLLPAPGDRRDVFCAGDVMALVVEGAPSAPLPADVVGALFDLTPAEARIASGLAEGLTPNELAAELGITVLTARTHIRAIRRKTGYSRVSDLTRVLLSLAKVAL